MASVLLFTEDSSRHADATLRALVGRACRRLDPSARPQGDFFRPVDDPQVLCTARATRWKSTRPQDDEPRRLLVRTIATHLLTPSGGFVVFHVDGDTKWSRAGESENGRKFTTVLLAALRRLLSGHLGGDTERVQSAMRRVFLWMPHWSIESWLYQATEVAARACRDNGCGGHVGQIEAWRADRRLLDEVANPKDAVCFRDRQNQALAEAFPAADVDAAGTSFHASLEAMRQSHEFLAALASTRPPWT